MAREAYKICEPNEALLAASDPVARLYFAIRDLAVLTNPHSFLASSFSAVTADEITPGSPKKIWTNTYETPACVALQLQGTASALPGYLIVSNDKPSCTLAKARLRDFATSAKLSCTLAPNESLWIDITHPDGLATPLNVIWTAVRLHGAMSDY